MGDVTFDYELMDLEDDPEKMRSVAVRVLLARHAAKVFARQPEARSLLLSVSQYYCDEAIDAVHSSLTPSPRAAPAQYLSNAGARGGDDGDDDGDDGGDAPGAYDPEAYAYAYLPWDDNGSAIRAFAAFCDEDGGEEGGESSRPYAVARRVDGAAPGEAVVELEVVGALARPWAELGDGVFPQRFDEDDDDDDDAPRAKKKGKKGAAPAARAAWPDEAAPFLAAVYASPDDDAPRAVLADWLTQRGDPRGAWIVAELRDGGASAAGRREVLEANGRAWLGALADVVPRSSTAWARGFPDALGVYARKVDAASAWYRAPSWATARAVFFYAGSATFVTPAMRGARYLGPLDAKGLADLARVGAPPALAVLDVDASRKGVDAALAAVALPASARALRVRAKNPAAVLAKARAGAAWWPRLESLEVAGVEPDALRGVVDLARSHPALREVAWCEVDASGDVTGWRVSVAVTSGEASKVARVTRVGYGGESSETVVAALKSLGRVVERVELAPSWAWSPDEAEAKAFAAATRLAASVAGGYTPEPWAHPTRMFAGPPERVTVHAPKAKRPRS